jgi:hypothetical protein
MMQRGIGYNMPFVLSIFVLALLIFLWGIAVGSSYGERNIEDKLNTGVFQLCMNTLEESINQTKTCADYHNQALREYISNLSECQMIVNRYIGGERK